MKLFVHMKQYHLSLADLLNARPFCKLNTCMTYYTMWKIYLVTSRITCKWMCKLHDQRVDQICLTYNVCLLRNRHTKICFFKTNFQIKLRYYKSKCSVQMAFKAYKERHEQSKNIPCFIRWQLLYNYLNSNLFSSLI